MINTSGLYGCRILISNDINESFRIDSKSPLQEAFISSSTITVGASKEADLRLKRRGISEQHLKIEIIDGEIFLTDLSFEKSVQVSGKPIFDQSKFPYNSSEIIQLGQSKVGLRVECFKRMMPVQEEAGILVKEAREKARQIVHRAKKIKYETKIGCEEYKKKAIEQAKNHGSEVLNKVDLKKQEIEQIILSKKQSMVDLEEKINEVEDRFRQTQENWRRIEEEDKKRELASMNLIDEEKKLREKLESTRVHLEKENERARSENSSLQEMRLKIEQEIRDLQGELNLEKKSGEEFERELKELSLKVQRENDELSRLQEKCRQVEGQKEEKLEELRRITDELKAGRDENRGRLEKEYQKMLTETESHFSRMRELEASKMRYDQSYLEKLEKNRIGEQSKDISQKIQAFIQEHVLRLNSELEFLKGDIERNHFSETVQEMNSRIPNLVEESVNEEFRLRRRMVSELKTPNLSKHQLARKYVMVFLAVIFSGMIGAYIHSVQTPKRSSYAKKSRSKNNRLKKQRRLKRQNAKRKEFIGGSSSQASTGVRGAPLSTKTLGQREQRPSEEKSQNSF